MRRLTASRGVIISIMAKLRMPVERAGKMLADRIRAGEDVAAKVKLAEATGGYRDWLDLFATWRNSAIAG